MFFVLSKTLGLLLEPLIIPYLCLICAVLAFWRRRRLLGRFFVLTAILLPLLYGVIPLSSQPLQFIENHIKPADLAERQIDGIIVLADLPVMVLWRKAATNQVWGQPLNDLPRRCNGIKNFPQATGI